MVLLETLRERTIGGVSRRFLKEREPYPTLRLPWRPNGLAETRAIRLAGDPVEFHANRRWSGLGQDHFGRQGYSFDEVSDIIVGRSGPILKCQKVEREASEPQVENYRL